MIRIDITGVDAFLAGVEKQVAAFDVAARATATEAAAWVEAEAKGNFVGSHRRGEPHVGGPRPNVVTGNARRSITHEPIRRVGVAAYYTRVGPTAVYGRRLQLGWPGPSDGLPGHQVTKPYPYMPDAYEVQAHLSEIAQRNWRRAVL